MFSFLRRFLTRSRASSITVPQSVDMAWTLAPEDVAALRSPARLPMGPNPARMERLRNEWPAEIDRTVAAAEQVLSHRFSLLGVDDFEPGDLSRPPHPDGYRWIDWHLDPGRQLRFPTGFPHKSWDMATMRPGLADIKLPWELARCQHWPLLAQAWALTGDERYACEIAHQLDDFVAANPVGVGVNWVCTMDVALRAANWAVTLQILQAWEGPDPDFWSRACHHLLALGHFIRGNLEDKYEVTSNHFLSNVVGLLYVAAVFVDRPQGQQWLDWCVAMLEREMRVQILPDGADFESSIPYHRLVTELFLGAWHVSHWIRRPLSEGFRTSLEKMIDYLVGVMRPDGLMPQVGDADDGRLHILSGYGNWQPQDARHLLAPAALALGRPDWRGLAGPVGAWEAAWWGFDEVTGTEVSVPLGAWPAHATFYPNAGHAVSRAGGHYLLVSNAIVGTEGFGNHKHNDQLSFELHIAGQPLIVDPGSYVYTSDPEARNRFRGTAFHNTVMVDGIEQNEMNPEWLFRLFEKALPQTLAFEASASRMVYEGCHEGYARLPVPLRHRRRFVHDRQTGQLDVEDELRSEGGHELSWHFHLAPGVPAQLDPGGAILRLWAGGQHFELQWSGPELVAELTASQYSPSYGRAQPCLALNLRTKMQMVGGSCWAFRLCQSSPRAECLS